jgi:hypothetical protein
MAGAIVALVFARRADDAAADAHALEVHDGLGKDRETRRRRAVRPGDEPLAVGDGELVVDPALVRIPRPGVEIFGRDIDVRRAIDGAEILLPPGIGFADRHSGGPLPVPN